MKKVVEGECSVDGGGGGKDLSIVSAKLVDMADALEDNLFGSKIDSNAKDPEGKASIQYLNVKVPKVKKTQKRIIISWKSGHSVVQHLDESGTTVKAFYVGEIIENRASGIGKFVVVRNSLHVREASVGEWAHDTMMYGKFKTKDRVEFGKFHMGCVQGLLSYNSRGQMIHAKGMFREGAVELDKASKTQEDDESFMNACIQKAQNAVSKASGVVGECRVRFEQLLHALEEARVGTCGSSEGRKKRKERGKSKKGKRAAADRREKGSRYRSNRRENDEGNRKKKRTCLRNFPSLCSSSLSAVQRKKDESIGEMDEKRYLDPNVEEKKTVVLATDPAKMIDEMANVVEAQRDHIRMIRERFLRYFTELSNKGFHSQDTRKALGKLYHVATSTQSHREQEAGHVLKYPSVLKTLLLHPNCGRKE